MVRSEILDRMPPHDDEAEEVVLAAIVRGMIVLEARSFGSGLIERCEVGDFRREWARCLFVDLRTAYRRRIADLPSLAAFLRKGGTWGLLEQMTTNQWYFRGEERVGTGVLPWLRWWLAERSVPDTEAFEAKWLPRLRDVAIRRQTIRILTALLADIYRIDGASAVDQVADAVSRLNVLRRGVSL